MLIAVSVADIYTNRTNSPTEIFLSYQSFDDLTVKCVDLRLDWIDRAYEICAEPLRGKIFETEEIENVRVFRHSFGESSLAIDAAAKTVVWREKTADGQFRFSDTGSLLTRSEPYEFLIEQEISRLVKDFLTTNAAELEHVSLSTELLETVRRGLTGNLTRRRDNPFDDLDGGERFETSDAAPELQITRHHSSVLKNKDGEYFQCGKITVEESEYLLYVSRDVLALKLDRHIKARLKPKTRKVARILYQKLLHFIRNHFPSAVIKNVLRAFRAPDISPRLLSVAWQNESFLEEIRAKAPALMYPYLSALIWTQNTIGDSDPKTAENANHYLPWSKKTAWKTIQETYKQMTTRGMAGLKETVFNNAIGSSYALTKSQWKTLVKLPSSVWSREIFTHRSGDKIQSLLALLAENNLTDAPVKYTHFKFYVRHIFGTQETLDENKLWRIIAGESARRKARSVDFADQMLHVRDYLRANPALELRKNEALKGWKHFETAAARWAENINLENLSATDAATLWRHGIELYGEADKLAVNLRQGAALAGESDWMRHCVRSYIPQCRQGLSLIYHLIQFGGETERRDFQTRLEISHEQRDWRKVFKHFREVSRNRQATAELQRTAVETNYRVGQIKGFRDKSMPDFTAFAGRLKSQVNATRKTIETTSMFDAPTLIAGSDFDTDIPF